MRFRVMAIGARSDRKIPGRSAEITVEFRNDLDLTRGCGNVRLQPVRFAGVDTMNRDGVASVGRKRRGACRRINGTGEGDGLGCCNDRHED